MLAASELNDEELEKIKGILDQLAQECPHIPDRVFRKMEKDPPEPLRFNKS